MGSEDHTGVWIDKGTKMKEKFAPLELKQVDGLPNTVWH